MERALSIAEQIEGVEGLDGMSDIVSAAQNRLLAMPESRGQMGSGHVRIAAEYLEKGLEQLRQAMKQRGEFSEDC